MPESFDIISIGAALVDMVAKVERHPLEDDEVFVSDLKLLSGGAAANTAHACAKLGLKTAFIGKLGLNDTFGKKIISDFEKVSVNTTLLKYSDDQGTGSAYVALNSSGDRRIYAHSGAANVLTKNDIQVNEICSSKIIFLSSLKNLEPFIEAATIARENNIVVVLNPGMLIIDQGFEVVSNLLKRVDIFILSQREYTTLLNVEKEELDPKSIKSTLNPLLSLGIKVLIITMGEKGAFLQTKDEGEFIPPSKVEHVIDTTGAGDAFSAGFISRFVQNMSLNFNDLKKNVEVGNFVAGKCIGALGARNGIPNKDEIIQFFT